MKLIISPAKKMNLCDTLPSTGLPLLIDRSRLLATTLRSMGYEQLKALWGCSDRLARAAFEQLRFLAPDSGWDEEGSALLTPAALSYEGIQYQSMAPSVMTTDQLTYLQEHLRILSGFYGVLRPFDGVVPYRLEMQARLACAGQKNLYGFWGDALAQALAAETDVVVNLASVEYAKAVTPHLQGGQGVRVITCLFGDVRADGRFTQRATYAKMARGSFVRWCAENHIEDPGDFPAFDIAYRLDEERSTPDTLIFTSTKGEQE